MCGLTGFHLRDGGTTSDAVTIQSMSQAQSHRGPDDAGHAAIDCRSGSIEPLEGNGATSFRTSADLFFGFRRLSILDLSLNGHQPMASPDGQVLLMLNGEIYNAFDFVPELESEGYRFRGKSDTEVVLNLYLVHGLEGMLSRLNGMFSIAIYDSRLGRLFLARDRFGIKPLYILENERFFAFSSELKSFGYLPGFRFSLDQKELSEFLMFRHNRDRTLLEDIRQLPPGMVLSYDPSTGDSRSTTYQTEASTNAIESPEQFAVCLERAIEAQLISDVPLGCQLSGGVDSSLVTHFAAQRAGADMNTVSVVFADERFSEETHIDYVEQTLGVRGHRFQLSPEYYIQRLDAATWHLEQPISHPNTIGVMLLSERAREFVTVLLSGEGADELLAGYSRFLALLHPWGKSLLSRLRGVRGSRFQELLAYRDPAWRAVTATLVSRASVARRVYPALDESAAIEPRLDLYRATAGSPLERQRRYEMATYLPDLLLRQDKMSMAASIENRVPYLDNPLVNAAFTIDREQLMGRGPNGPHGKLILKRICEKVFGRDFTYRKKQGFGIPLRQFMARSSFQNELHDRILPGIEKRGVFAVEVLRRTARNIKAAEWADIELLWTMVAFESWAQQFLDADFQSGIDRTSGA
ncbi:asparagine synthase (glutamine-hydrolyzing) [Wenzhouxiangella sp. EGI_FJ10305]|uniref:asparagine synthase (glutamine-hydrolyzing) n=1 Tax=Wenzhouxiangella sp. EGI_FJ10305 TaxID=3243768 RepID=UPI0035D985FB